jgi:fatty acid desaturase
MEDREKNPLETLLERGEEYGKTSLELLKLKTLDKTSGLASEFGTNVFVIIIIIFFFLMGSAGVALWLGDILGKLWYGFFVVAGFYGVTGVVLHFFLHNWLKKVFSNLIIKQMLK